MNKMLNKVTYKPVIGLEVHIELSTNSKMFCGCPTDHFGKKPNTQTCPVCLGLPGALPVPNKRAIEWCVMLGLALNCEINKNSNFDRKHYFYPDLPKGYQISQYEDPFCHSGKFQLPITNDQMQSGSNSNKEIQITRIHLEEDTAKLQHTELNGKKVSLIDFNRSGVPLVELVTEPDFTSVEDVVSFSQELQTIARYLGISSADMEKGSMRLEANISLREVSSIKYPVSKDLPSYKVELKNINSFRFLKKAIEFEIERQRTLLSKGTKPVQETRGWDEKSSKTFSQRSKEEAKDYRYIPDPDLPPIEVSESQVSSIRKQIPELPAEKRDRYKKEFKLPDNYIEILVSDHKRALYFEEALRQAQGKPEISAKTIARIMVNQNLDVKYPEPAGLVKKLHELSSMNFVSSIETKKTIKQVLHENPDIVKKYQDGQGSVVGFFIGQVQKILKGKGDPKKISELLIKKLQS